MNARCSPILIAPYSPAKQCKLCLTDSRTLCWFSLSCCSLVRAVESLGSNAGLLLNSVSTSSSIISIATDIITSLIDQGDSLTSHTFNDVMTSTDSNLTVNMDMDRPSKVRREPVLSSVLVYAKYCPPLVDLQICAKANDIPSPQL